jgi:hypothetical protein
VVADSVRVALEKKFSKRHIVRLVTARANEQYLSRRLATLSVARDAGINISRYATDEELAILRRSDLGQGQPQSRSGSDAVPPPATPTRPRVGSKAAAKSRPRAPPRTAYESFRGSREGCVDPQFDVRFPACNRPASSGMGGSTKSYGETYAIHCRDT